MAAGTPRAVPVSTIARPESNLALTRNPVGSDLTEYREANGGVTSCVPRCIMPHDAERDTYVVLDDFGDRHGCARRETDAESADRAPLIRDLLDVE
jgi:hypothetical protein